MENYKSGSHTVWDCKCHLVVTGHGIAGLRGMTVVERAEAFIAVAHPEFRALLLKRLSDGLI